MIKVNIKLKYLKYTNKDIGINVKFQLIPTKDSSWTIYDTEGEGTMLRIRNIETPSITTIIKASNLLQWLNSGEAKIITDEEI